MAQPQFYLHWELGLSAAGPLKAFSTSPCGRILLGSFTGLEKNRLIMFDRQKSQLVRADIDTGNHVITSVAWGRDLHFFLGNDHGDVYCGKLRDDDQLHLDEILVRLGSGAPIVALSFSHFEQVLAVTIGSRVHAYKPSEGDHDGRNWTHLKTLEPFGDHTSITAMRFVGRSLNQLLVGSNEGMSVWLTEDFMIRPLTADYAFSVVHCATTSRANYIAVTTQAHAVILWPLFDSGPATYERRVINITGRESSEEDVSPVALTDSGLIITRSMSGYIYFKKITKPSETSRQHYGTHCKISSLEAQGEYLFTGGNSPSGLLTISCWSPHPPDFDQDPQRQAPIISLGDILHALKCPTNDSTHVPGMDTLNSAIKAKYRAVYHFIKFLGASVVGIVVTGFMLGGALYLIVFFNHALLEFMGPDAAQLSTSNISVVREAAHRIMHPSMIIAQHVIFVMERLMTFLGYLIEKLGVSVVEYVDWIAGGILVVVYIFLSNLF
ncbi:hypothetical protein FRC11_008348 [Ceratobasidium sp. 423]|nr:hypothetical protein FRC11_008348 [Ceratobasidium sp. 423]